MVEEHEIAKALDWLRDNAKAMGDAKARLVKAEHMVRHIEALEFRAASGSSAEAKKAEARASEAYLDAINEEAFAAGEYEMLKSLREAAALKCEVWRSEQANFRSMKI
jgi:hypothetical protein